MSGKLFTVLCFMTGKMVCRPLVVLLFIFVMSLQCTMQADAATYTWTGASTSEITTSHNWSPATTPDSTDTAVFGVNPPHLSLTASHKFDVLGVVFNGSNYTITHGNGGALSIGSGGISGAGATSATFINSGIMQMYGSTGGATINNSQNITFNAGSNASSSIINHTNGILTFDDGARLGSAIITNSDRIHINTAVDGSDASIILNGGTITLNGNDKDMHFGSLSGQGGDITLGNRSLTIGYLNKNESFSGAINGSGVINKVGTGTLSFLGAVGYTGTTTVNAGGLSLSSAPGDLVLGSSAIVNVQAYNASQARGVTINVDPTSSGVLESSNSIGLGNTALSLSFAAGTYDTQKVYTIVDAGSSSITGQFSSVYNPSALLTHTLSYNAHNVGMQLSTITISDALSSGGSGGSGSSGSSGSSGDSSGSGSSGSSSSGSGSDNGNGNGGSNNGNSGSNNGSSNSSDGSSNSGDGSSNGNGNGSSGSGSSSSGSGSQQVTQNNINVANAIDQIVSSPNISTGWRYVYNNMIVLTYKELYQAIDTLSPDEQNNTKSGALSNTMSSVTSSTSDRKNAFMNSRSNSKNSESNSFANGLTYSQKSDAFADSFVAMRSKNFAEKQSGKFEEVFADVKSLATINDFHKQGDKGSFWVQPFGSIGHKKNSANDVGYDSKAGGLSIGLDAVLNSDNFVGMSASFANTDVNFANNIGDSNITNWMMSVYGVTINDSFYDDFSLTASYNLYKESRNLSAFGVTASNRHKGYSISPHWGFGYMRRDYDVLSTYYIDLDYVYIHENEYFETGAGVLNLNVKSKQSHNFNTKFGVKASKEFEYNSYTITPEISAGYLVTTPIGKEKTVSSFMDLGGITFVNVGANKKQNMMSFGVKSNFAPKDYNAAWTLGYNLNMNSKTYTHQAYAIYSILF